MVVRTMLPRGVIRARQKLSGVPIIASFAVESIMSAGEVMG